MIVSASVSESNYACIESQARMSLAIPRPMLEAISFQPVLKTVTPVSSSNSTIQEKRTVYWAAVDKYKKAMMADPSVSDKAKELISRYSNHFPLKEETFFRGYVDGQEYTVGCWINEKTVVRTRQN